MTEMVTEIIDEKPDELLESKMSDKLLNCPFCGSEPTIETPHDVCCSNSECECSYVIMDMEQWNRRATDPLVVELREACETAKQWCDAGSNAYIMIEAAIAKAGGK